MKGFWVTFRAFLQNYLRVVQLVWRASPRYAFFATFFAMLSGVTAPLQIWLSKIIIDSIIHTVQQQTPGSSIGWTPLLVPVGALVLTLTLGETSRRIAESTVQILRFQTMHHVQYRLLKKATQLDMAFYESSTFYDQLDLARRESYRALNLALLTTDSIGLFLSLIITLSLVAQFHPVAALVMVLISAPQIIINSQYAKDIFALMNRQTPAQRMVEYLAQLLVEREAVKEVRLFGLQEPFLNKFQHFGQSFMAETAHITFQQERQNIFLLILAALGTGTIWIFAIVQALWGRITIGELTLVIQSVERVRNDLGSLFKRGGIFYENSLFVRNLFDFLDLQPNAIAGSLDRTLSAAQPFPLPIPTHCSMALSFGMSHFVTPARSAWFCKMFRL